LGAARCVDHPLLADLELHAVGPHLLDRVEDPMAEPRQRRRSVGMVVLVAVRAKSKEPGREAPPLAGSDVQGPVPIEQGPHAIERGPGRGRGPRLRWAEPASVRERRPGADAVALYHGYVEPLPAQVVRTAEAGHAAPHHDDVVAHGPALAAAVTCSSIRM